jgi:hypothetical protein
MVTLCFADLARSGLFCRHFPLEEERFRIPLNVIVDELGAVLA